MSLENVRGTGEGGVYIAYLLNKVRGNVIGCVVMYERRAGCYCCCKIAGADNGQRVVIDVDEGEGIFGDVAVSSDDQGNRFAGVTYDILSQCLLGVRVGQRRMGNE